MSDWHRWFERQGCVRFEMWGCWVSPDRLFPLMQEMRDWGFEKVVGSGCGEPNGNGFRWVEFWRVAA